MREDYPSTLEPNGLRTDKKIWYTKQIEKRNYNTKNVRKLFEILTSHSCDSVITS